MKNTLFLLAVFSGFITFAGFDLDIDGKFRQVKKDLPVKWEISAKNAGKIVRGKELFSKALELTAGKTAVQAVTKQAFPVLKHNVIEIQAEVKGSGTAFLAVELIDANGKVAAVQRAAVRLAGKRFEDIEGKIRLAEYARFSPVKIRIIIGVEANSKVVFDDVEAEID